jgi:hypothetical protein
VALLVLGLHVIAGLGQSGLLVGCLLSTCHKGWLVDRRDAACHMKQVQAAMHSIADQHNGRTLLHGGCSVSIPVLCQYHQVCEPFYRVCHPATVPAQVKCFQAWSAVSTAAI